MCPYKLEPLKDRLKSLSQGEFLDILNFHTGCLGCWNKETEIINKEALRRGITYNSNGMTLGVERVEATKTETKEKAL